jgi:hypothetical protein
MMFNHFEYNVQGRRNRKPWTYELGNGVYNGGGNTYGLIGLTNRSIFKPDLID